jgi:ligand-binding SRPBCC domain-containing protein
MKVYRLERTQIIPTDLDTAWDFFSSPKNLPVITPDFMQFQILSGLSEKMFPGQIITYKVKPFKLGMALSWVTEILHVKDKEYFVDDQRKGPYAMWHHKHFFKVVEGGVECRDMVDYALPFGVLGQMMNSLVVKDQLNKIFEYRHAKLKEIFGEYRPIISMNDSKRSA